jgi:hypothetical protein
MIRVEIIANQSVEENILDAFRDEGVGKFYTKYPSVLGVGSSGPRMGDAVWPEENFALVIWCEEEEAAGIARAVARVKKVFPQEGIKLFIPEAPHESAPQAVIEQKEVQSLLPAPSFDAAELHSRLLELQARLAEVSAPGSPRPVQVAQTTPVPDSSRHTDAAETTPVPAPHGGEPLKTGWSAEGDTEDPASQPRRLPGPGSAEYQGPEAENR